MHPKKRYIPCHDINDMNLCRPLSKPGRRLWPSVNIKRDSKLRKYVELGWRFSKRCDKLERLELLAFREMVTGRIACLDDLVGAERVERVRCREAGV